MDCFDTLRKLTSEAGKLLHTEDVNFEADSPHFVVGTVLHFENLAIFINARPDDDTLVLALTPLMLEVGCRIILTTNIAMWAAVYGHECRWAWLLTNQQGYMDGLRLEFATQPKATFIELEVAASAIRYRCFQRID